MITFKFNILLISLVFLVSCYDDEPRVKTKKIETFNFKYDTKLKTIELFENNKLIYATREENLLWPITPDFVIDTNEYKMYFNNYKTSLICYDLKMKKVINEIFFRFNTENSEIKCDVIMKNDWIIFSTNKNLILFSKDLKKSFNVVDKIYFDNNISPIEEVKLLNVSKDYITMKYRINNENAFIKRKFRINTIFSDTINLHNLPPPRVILGK